MHQAIKGDDAAFYQAIRVMLEILPAGEQKAAAGAARIAEAKGKLGAMLGLDAED